MAQAKSRCILSAAVCLALGGMPCGLSLWAQGQQAPKADLVLIHGHILTEDASDSTAQAIAIQGQRIVAVGTDAAIMAMAGPATHVIDLQGRTATPGLIDSHAHIAAGGVNELFHVDLSDAASVAEVVRRVQAGIA